MLKKEKGQAVPAHGHLTHQGPETQNRASGLLGHQPYRLGLPRKGRWPSCGLPCEEGRNTFASHPCPPGKGCRASSRWSPATGPSQPAARSLPREDPGGFHVCPGPTPAAPGTSQGSAEKQSQEDVCRESQRYFKELAHRPWGLTSPKSTGQTGDPGQG